MGDHVLLVDGYDRADLVHAARDVRVFSGARTRLRKDLGEPGAAALEDLFLVLLKSVPQVSGPDQVGGPAVVVRQVVIEALSTPAVISLRRFTVGDRVQAALSATALESLVRCVFERFAPQCEAATGLAELVVVANEALEAAVAADDVVDQAIQANASEAVVDELVAEALDARRVQGEAAMDAEVALVGLQGALEGRGPTMRAMVAASVAPATAALRQSFEVGFAWGVAPGALVRMSAHERLVMARRMSSTGLREAAELFGRMHNVAFAGSRRNGGAGVEKMIGLTLGGDLAAMVGSEWVNLAVPELEIDLLARLGEHRVLVHDRAGDHAGRGGIVLALDGSLSMSGARERFSKALMLALWHLAREQHRTMHVIHFGGRSQLRHVPFVHAEDFTHQALFECAEISFQSGTDFESPMTKALELVRAEHDETGQARSDVVFVSDGECNVSRKFMTDYLAAMADVESTTWAVLVSDRATIPAGPLERMSQGKVSHVTDLTSGVDVTELLRGAA